jgi:haloalkane dehalogenase
MGERFPGGRHAVTDGVTVRRGYVDVAAGQLHYRCAGNSAKPTIVLLHQSPSSSAMYEPLMERLADDFYLLAPDTPGFGNSDPLAGDVEDLEIGDYAAVIYEFLCALGVTSCGLFGHHTGAAIAVQLAHDSPQMIAAMALSGPTLLSEEQARTLPDAASPFPASDDGGHLQAMWQRIRSKDPEAPLSLVQREMLSAFASGPSYQASYRAVTRQDFATQLATINCPVLVFAGDEDPLYGAVAPTLERLRHGVHFELPGGERTYVCERQAGIVAAALAEFFTKMESGK